MALGANFFFALGSQFFTYFSRKNGSVWMNAYKALVAQVCFIAWLFYTHEFSWIGLETSYPLLLSGFIGLGLGDVFLLMSFKEMGAGKTLTLFAFQPLIMGVAGYYFFDQGLNSERFWAIFFFILCVVIFSRESFKTHGHWGLKGIAFALLGMLLDAAGVIITRAMFEGEQELSPMLINFYRTAGALVFFGLYHFYRPIKLTHLFKNLSVADRYGVTFGSFIGTFVSLSLFLTALKYAHLASLSAISITSAIFSFLMECLWLRKWPSAYTYSALVSFLLGMFILIKS